MINNIIAANSAPTQTKRKADNKYANASNRRACIASAVRIMKLAVNPIKIHNTLTIMRGYKFFL